MQRPRPTPGAHETASPSPRSDNNPLSNFGSRLGRDRVQESFPGHSTHSISSTISRDNTAGCASRQAALLADWGRKKQQRDTKPLLFPGVRGQKYSGARLAGEREMNESGRVTHNTGGSVGSKPQGQTDKRAPSPPLDFTPGTRGLYLEKEFRDMYLEAASPDALIRRNVTDYAPTLVAASSEDQKLIWRGLASARFAEAAKEYISRGRDPVMIWFEYQAFLGLPRDILAQIKASSLSKPQHQTDVSNNSK